MTRKKSLDHLPPPASVIAEIWLAENYAVALGHTGRRS